MPSKDEVLDQVITFFGDVGREAFYSIINDEVEMRLEYERKSEIRRATGALYEAKVTDKVIIQLLHDYWHIDKYRAAEALRVEKTVNKPIKVLVTYLKSQSYKHSGIRKFMRNNNVEEKLENNISLWKLSNSPGKLMKAVEERKPTV